MNNAEPNYFKGRGAQLNTTNRFLREEYSVVHIEGVDTEQYENSSTSFIPEFPKKIINRVDSPDIPLEWSMNPYQGCEHGCIYCYARPVHEYWGYSAGLDFERKIVVKHNAPELLARQLEHKSWKPQAIMLSGNTDCYQPAEREFQLTRRMLEVLLQYRNPVGIITKNSLVLRDLDLLKALNRHGLVHVIMSITTLDESLRRVMEPRTATAKKKIAVIEKLAAEGIPVGVMMAPIIPGLNNHEIPEVMKATSEAGASMIGYTMVRLNGPVAELFEDWVRKNFPNKAEKILKQVSRAHGGKLGDSRFGKRMRGEGDQADAIRDLFNLQKKKYFGNRKMPPYNLEAFMRKAGIQGSLF